jgi:hypothetical protein
MMNVLTNTLKETEFFYECAKPTLTSIQILIQNKVVAE